MKTEEQRFRIEILVSVLTLLLTPIFSGAVVAFQLSREHSFVAQHDASVQRDKLTDQKTQLLADTVKHIAEMATLKTLVFNSSHIAKLRIVLSATKKDDPEPKQSANDEEFQAMRVSVTRLLTSEAELQSTLQIAAFAFGPQVRAAIQQFIAPKAEGTDKKEDFHFPTIEEVLSEPSLDKNVVNDYAQRGRAVVAAMAQ